MIFLFIGLITMCVTVMGGSDKNNNTNRYHNETLTNFFPNSNKKSVMLIYDPVQYALKMCQDLARQMREAQEEIEDLKKDTNRIKKQQKTNKISSNKKNNKRKRRDSSDQDSENQNNKKKKKKLLIPIQELKSTLNFKTYYEKNTGTKKLRKK